MRVRTMVVGLLQAALLMACERSATIPDPASKAVDEAASVPRRPITTQAADAVALGSVGEREVAASLRRRPRSSGPAHSTFDPATRLIVRTGQASIEVDSLEPAMAELRRLAQRAGGFVADASVQSGRDQLRQATLEIKVPAARFDELTAGLQPLGRLEFVNVRREDVSEEFVDLTARVANGRRLEERLIELLRTRTGKLQDVLTVERELARVREEIERMEGRLRYLKTSAAAQHALGQPARAAADRRDARPGSRIVRGVPAGLAQLRGACSPARSRRSASWSRCSASAGAWSSSAGSGGAGRRRERER